MSLRMKVLMSALILFVAFAALASAPTILSPNGTAHKDLPASSKANSDPTFLPVGDPMPGGGTPNDNRTGG